MRGQFFLCDPTDHAAIRASLELRIDSAHKWTHRIRAGCNCGADCGADFILADLRRKILLQCCDFGAFLFGEIEALAFLVHLNRFAAALDPLAQHVEYLVVGGIALQFDPLVLDVRQNCSQKQHAALSCALRAELRSACSLSPRDDITSGDDDGSCESQRSSCASDARSAFRNADACADPREFPPSRPSS